MVGDTRKKTIELKRKTDRFIIVKITPYAKITSIVNGCIPQMTKQDIPIPESSIIGQILNVHARKKRVKPYILLYYYVLFRGFLFGNI